MFTPDTYRYLTGSPSPQRIFAVPAKPAASSAPRGFCLVVVLVLLILGAIIVALALNAEG
ncbi:MAG: hypothetical protein AB7E32_03120 [Desulfovibrio sp.]